MKRISPPTRHGQRWSDRDDPEGVHAGATSAQRISPPTRHGQRWSDHDDPDGCPAATQSNVGAGPSADSVAAQRA